MDKLQELFKQVKQRPNKNILYNTAEYINYSVEVRNNIKPLTKERISSFKGKKQVHYMQGTIIGKFMYNACIIGITDKYIQIQPCSPKWKGKCLRFNIGEENYIAVGWL